MPAARGSIEPAAPSLATILLGSKQSDLPLQHMASTGKGRLWTKCVTSTGMPPHFGKRGTGVGTSLPSIQDVAPKRRTPCSPKRAYRGITVACHMGFGRRPGPYRTIAAGRVVSDKESGG